MLISVHSGFPAFSNHQHDQQSSGITAHPEALSRWMPEGKLSPQLYCPGLSELFTWNLAFSGALGQRTRHLSGHTQHDELVPCHCRSLSYKLYVHFSYFPKVWLPVEMNAWVWSHLGKSKKDAVTCNSQQDKLDDLITPSGLKHYETVWKKQNSPVWPRTKRNVSCSAADNDFDMVSELLALQMPEA